MACKKGMPRRSADDYGAPTISADDSTPSNCSFECVEKSHARDQALHFDCGVASRRPSFLPDAYELCGHFHGSLDGAWGDLTSACAEGPSVAFDHLRWEAPQGAIYRV